MSLKKISEYLFLGFLFLLPFQTVFLLREPFIDGEKWQYGAIAIYGTDILFLCFVIFSVIAYWKKNLDLRFMIDEWGLFRWLSVLKFKIIHHKSSVLLIALIVWSGLSLFWANDQMLAVYFFVKLLLGAGLFFVVRSLDVSLFKKVIFVLLLAGVVQSIIGIGQFVYQYSPESSLLGMSAHEASQAGSSVLKLDSGRFLRAYGTFPHPNMLGGFLGAVLMLGSMHYVSGIRYEKSWKCLREIVCTLSGLLLISLGLILTFSRTASLGVVFGMVAIGWYAFRQEDSWIQGRFLKIFLALGLASLVFGSVLYEQISPRFDMVTIEREGSVSERVLSLQDARALIAEQLIIGVGAGNFTAEIMQLQPERPVWNIQPVHNVFMLVWSELGLVGLLLFVGYLVFSLLPILKSKILHHNSAIFIALLTLVPSFFLDHWLYTSHFGPLFLFLLLGLATRQQRL